MNSSTHKKHAIIPASSQKRHVHHKTKGTHDTNKRHGHRIHNKMQINNKGINKNSTDKKENNDVMDMQNFTLFLVIIIFFMMLIPFLFCCSIMSGVGSSISPSTDFYGGA